MPGTHQAPGICFAWTLLDLNQRLLPCEDSVLTPELSVLFHSEFYLSKSQKFCQLLNAKNDNFLGATEFFFEVCQAEFHDGGASVRAGVGQLQAVKLLQ